MSSKSKGTNKANRFKLLVDMGAAEGIEYIREQVKQQSELIETGFNDVVASMTRLEKRIVELEDARKEYDETIRDLKLKLQYVAIEADEDRENLQRVSRGEQAHFGGDTL